MGGRGAKKGAPHREKNRAAHLRGKTKSQASFSNFTAFPLLAISNQMIRLLIIHKLVYMIKSHIIRR